MTESRAEFLSRIARLGFKPNDKKTLQIAVVEEIRERAERIQSVSGLAISISGFLQNEIDNIEVSGGITSGEVQALIDTTSGVLATNIATTSGVLSGDINTVSGNLDTAIGTVSGLLETKIGVVSGLIVDEIASTNSRLQFRSAGTPSGILPASDVTPLKLNDPAVYADGAAGGADPTGSEGWNFENNSNKINWYYFYQVSGAPRQYTLGDLESVYLKALSRHASQTRIPFLTIYTVRENDGNDAGSWYRSRLNYELENSQIPSGFVTSGIPFVIYAKNDVAVFTNFRHEEAPLSFSSNGPQADDEVILYMALSTDSSESTGGYNFTAQSIGFQTSDNDLHEYNFVS
jgi:hypothetical protein